MSAHGSAGGRGGRAAASPRAVRRLARLAAWLWLAATLAATWAILRTDPLAAPFVDRSAGRIAAATAAALTREATPEALATRLDAALAAGDLADVEALLALADRRGVRLPPATGDAARSALATRSGPLACARCAARPASCATPNQLVVCNLPFELTPLGDAAALARGGAAAAAGGDVDRLEMGLAAVGAGASLAIVATGGASAPVKAGATLLRVARRAGALAPGLAADLARGGRRSRVASDLSTLRAAAGPSDALAILRRADDAAELSRLARFAAATGPDARPALALLGKARVLRLTVRLADAAIALIALLAALAAQLGQMAGAALLRRAAR